MEQVIEKWAGKVNEVTIGGARGKKVTIGGMSTLPFLKFEGQIPHPSLLALEVWDCEPTEWPDLLKDSLKDVLSDPVAWAVKCEKEFKADLICLRLASTHPDRKNASGEEAAQTVNKILEATTLPLIIIGSGQASRDTEIFLPAAEAAKGEKCLMGIAFQENYKTLTAACQSCGHNIIAETPIDINLAKQLNILISDMGFPVENIVMHHNTGALGYGFEYTYSIMERTRVAALQGDKMMASPMISFVGQEAWKTKEAKNNKLWEFTTGIGFLQSGADILVLSHPEVFAKTREFIKEAT